MKTIILVCSLIMVPALAFAKMPTKQLQCGQNGPEGFRTVLDPNGFTPNSGFFNTVQPFVYYNYTGARMICEGHTPETLRCVGYWNMGREIGEVTTEKDPNGNLIAKFVTAKVYGSILRVLPCKVN